MLLNSIDAFLALTRLGIGHPVLSFPEHVEWSEIKDLSEQHGLSAIVLDGVERLPVVKRPSKELTLQWIGDILHSYEQRYELYQRAIAELAKFYNGHDYKMMLLKGYACCLDWPKLEHRPCGDIDIWQFGKQKEADAAISKKLGIKINTSEHHHTVFYWCDFMVENHYDFINVHHHKSNAEIEKILKELGEDDSCFVEIDGEKVYLPSPNLHALFLLKHTMSHFAAEGIMLRQVLDWGFFVEKHRNDVDWCWLEGVLEQYGMMEAYNIFNAICVDDLGFDAGLFRKVQFKPLLKEKVLKEILIPEFGAELPNGLFPRICFKLKRWYGSSWKHRLCYKESMLSAFLSGIWNHILKPSSI